MTDEERPVGAHVIFYRTVTTPGKHEIQAVLLCKRTHDAPVYPGYWALSGGRLGEHEDPVEGLCREVREELETRTLDQALQGIQHSSDVPVIRGTTTLPIRYYYAPLNEDMDSLMLRRTQKKVEGEGLGWFTEEEINHLWLRPEDRTALLWFFSPARIRTGDKSLEFRASAHRCAPRP
jgi:8-oxo-dGTP pyrophosphatase MutT (NUDIX family)